MARCATHALLRSALREWCIAFNDIVANVVEVVARWDALQHMDALPLWERQQLAVESLQVWAPLGHALGLGAISSNMEDICFQVRSPAACLRPNADGAKQPKYGRHADGARGRMRG